MDYSSTNADDINRSIESDPYCKYIKSSSAPTSPCADMEYLNLWDPLFNHKKQYHVDWTNTDLNYNSLPVHKEK
ncbi:unnamed protein product, partial [Iphiclides podalirius]